MLKYYGDVNVKSIVLFEGVIHIYKSRGTRL